MSLFTAVAPITITCYRRLSGILEKEVIAMGFPVENVFATGLEIRGTMNDCVKLNLNLFTASQILYSLGKFNAANADDVYRYVSQIRWENILTQDEYFSVTSHVQNDTINNNMFANVRVKDAIVDRFRQRKGSRPSTGSELKGAVVHLHWKDEQAEIFIDTSGESLARHGYRKIPGRAPMLESLAAATILSSQWDRKSAFVNPMCGSGTLAIEAALIATNSRPGLFRNQYGFMYIIGFNEDRYFKEQDLLEEQILDVTGLRIIATDHDELAVANAKKNSIAAGVSNLIEFRVCDFSETELPDEGKGVVFLNPEYGERMGEAEALQITYHEIGDFMKKKCGCYMGYIFTGNLDLAKKIGLKAKRRMEFYSGKIDCRLLEYELYAGTREEKRGA
jgi:putative N6-adenine-specific DNA methylase